jgi:hypothetical protein
MFALSLIIKEDRLELHGSSLTPPLRGCVRHTPERLQNGHCRERLDLVLQGSPGESRPFIACLQSFLERIRLGQPAHLQLQSEPRLEAASSRVYAGDFTWINGSVQPRGIGLRLELERDETWFYPWRSLPLSNRYGDRVVGGIRVDNRCDSLGENMVRVAAADISGDLPAPLRLTLRNDILGEQHIRNLCLGMRREVNALPLLEGESAQSELTFGVVPSAACNGAAYSLVQWSASTEHCLLYWVVSSAVIQGLHGAALRPLARFALAPDQELWLYWRVLQGGLYYRSSPQRIQAGLQLQWLPLICLPGAMPGFGSPADLRLELWGCAAAAGNHSLALDAVFLFGLDGWRSLHPLEGGSLAYGQSLVDDHAQARAVVVVEGGMQSTYRTAGSGLWLAAQQSCLLQVLYDHGAGCAVEGAIHLAAEVQPRVRVLP